MGSSKACGRKRKPDLEVLELFGLDDYSAKRMNLSKVHYKFTTVCIRPSGGIQALTTRLPRRRLIPVQSFPG